MDFPPEQCLDIAVILGKGDGGVHVILDARKPFEVAVDESLRLASGDAQIARKTKAGDAIDHPEIDRLGLPPNLGRHLVKRHVEHL